MDAKDHNAHGNHGHDSLIRFRDLVESIDDWLWEINRQGVYTFSSPQVQSILGYHPAEIVGKTPLDFMTPLDADRVRNDFYHALEHPSPFRLMDTEHLHKDGHVVTIDTSGNPFYDKHQDFLGYRGVDRDISHRLTMEQKETFLLKALDQMAEAALMVNKEENITYVNRAFKQLFGYSELDIIGRPLDVLSVDDPVSYTTRDTLALLQTKGTFKSEVLRRKANGDLLPVYLTASTIFDEHNRLFGYAGTYLDLTPLKKAASQLEQAYASVISAISLTVEQRDPYTSGHQKNVSLLSMEIAKKLGKDQQFIRGLELGAAIHDIGKIHIPAEILNRPGRLSEPEMDMIKTHPQVGYDIIKDIEFPWPVGPMILQHHERIDGSGYPNGLPADAICKEAKIIGVADVVDAITSHRPYRPAKGLDVALKEIRTNRGILYDEEVVDACLELFEKDGFSLQTDRNG